MKNIIYNRQNKGITLIALVITVIVLLILAGVALATLTGDSGILNNAENAKEQTTQANVKEKVQLAIMEHKIGQYSEGKTLQEYLEAAGATDVTESGTKGKMDGYTFEIKDGEVTITKETSNQLTLGDVYTEDMMWKEINYTTHEELPDGVKWIIIGQDEEGNVLATTDRPLGMTEGEEKYQYTQTTSGAAGWLTYEEDLNNHCGNAFTGSIQGIVIKPKSMNLKNVNEITGFIEPELKTYTFKDQTDNDYENKIVNYYHPDPNSNDSWSKEEIQYKDNAYWYGRKISDGSLQWSEEDTTESGVAYTGTLENLDFIIGPTDNSYCYLLASRIVNVQDDKALFGVNIVWQVGSGAYGVNYFAPYFCNTTTLSHNDSSDMTQFNFPVRPVVTISSDFIVEEQEDGTYKLAEDVSFVDSDLARYILGEDGNGIIMDSIADIGMNDNGEIYIAFKAGEAIAEEISFISMDYESSEQYSYVDIQYKQDKYRISINNDGITAMLEKYN